MTLSIVVCTYNPDLKIFKRLISSLAEMVPPTHSLFEIILVDNNSRIPIANIDFVKAFMSSRDNIHIVVERRPGLTSARLAGAEKANGEWLVYFDDDNEPGRYYLQELEKLIRQHENVGTWGPGNVAVEYVGDNVHPWFNENKYLFQERQSDKVKFDREETWLECYPYGTGLCIKKEIVFAYRQNIASGNYTLTDRIGKKLVSGGDTQLVFHAIKMGYAAGTSPALQLKHLISDRKLKFKYSLRQVYMTASCYVRAFNEIKFDSGAIDLQFPSNKDILKTTYTTFRVHTGKKSMRDVLVLLYDRLGQINARYFAANVEKRPLFLNLMERLINV